MFTRIFKCIFSLIMTGVAGVLSWFDVPWYAHGQELRLDQRFTMVWSDEFDGGTLNSSNWSVHRGAAMPEGYTDDKAQVRRGGYWHKDTVSVADGNLTISTRYEAEGLGGGGPGFYSDCISTEGLQEFLYGYFEVRCILPKGEGLWAAFWLLCPNMGNPPIGGASGAEVDVFESPYYREKWNKYVNTVSSAVHMNGYGEFLESKSAGTYRVHKPYDCYNTYGVEWNENEYIFYINGVESGRTSFGVSTRPEYLLLSTEVGAPESYSWAGNIHNNSNSEQLDSPFVVDYVRVYQYKAQG